MRRTISAASSGWLATINRLLAFSYQRNPGIPSFRPCRMPAWLAGVVGGSKAIHGWRVASPSRSNRPSMGTRPARSACCRTAGSVRPIWTTSRPGFGRWPPKVASYQPPDEHAVVGIVVATDTTRRTAVEQRQQTAPQTAVLCRPPALLAAPADDDDGHDWTARPHGLGDEVGQATNSQWRTTSEELSRAASRSPASSAGQGRRWLNPGARRP